MEEKFKVLLPRKIKETVAYVQQNNKNQVNINFPTVTLE